ncbi:hypothetical protein I588_04592 [Enterococcus pallens ATCC BAA-351]|uniref:Sensor histidine kinase NatK-like C-terminal domain-containing protein n=2 Tax=Enterococcus pallens TaxID=160454 RepID=R2T3A4_9ENTE|nr:hypothetical protein UAU_01661 [Enterococcus pallens ATCC BAA-351]EOU14942.1 hypothetical protein I588_04592 [Enterococcus pallens ATCC BAA-351]
MIGHLILLLGSLPLIISTYIFKSKESRISIDLLVTLVLIVLIRIFPPFSSETLKVVLLFFILFFSFYYSERKPLLSGIYSSLLFVNETVTVFLLNQFYPIDPTSLIFTMSMNFIISIIIAGGLSVAEKKLLQIVQQKSFIFSIVALLISLFSFFHVIKDKYLVEMSIPDNNQSIVFELLSDVILALFLFLAVVVIMAQRSESMRLEAESKKAIFENQLAYLKTIEKNAEEVRKFKHDYQNILLSMDTYFQEDKFDELKNYYYTQIKNSSESLNSTNTQLSKLTKIQNMALRSIFYVKLSIIESEKVNLILEVDKNFYVEEKDEIPLVRALGIILDNAVDALGELDHGELQIAVFENDGSNVVIVKNSCPEDLPPLYQLEEKGYSTKGPNRGIGLSNLQEIMEESDFLLETEIVDHYFIQKIVF